MLWGVGLNAILGYITIFTLCFTVTDPEALLDSDTGYPFIQLFYNVTKSHAGTDIMVAIVIITLISAVISEIATASRQIWSFARDNGLPFSPQLQKVGMSSPSHQAQLTPVRCRLRLAGTFRSTPSRSPWASVSSSPSSTWARLLP